MTSTLEHRRLGGELSRTIMTIMISHSLITWVGLLHPRVVWCRSPSSWIFFIKQPGRFSVRPWVSCEAWWCNSAADDISSTHWDAGKGPEERETEGMPLGTPMVIRLRLNPVRWERGTVWEGEREVDGEDPAGEGGERERRDEREGDGRRESEKWEGNSDMSTNSYDPCKNLASYRFL